MKNFGSVILIIYFTCCKAQVDSYQSDFDVQVSTSEIYDFTTLSPEFDKKINKTWSYIYPGTKWCGKGNKAKNDEDFGRFKRTDKCCRDHDRCPDKIKKGTTKYGIQNNSTVTMLSCQCDETFYDCLKGVRTRASKIVGTLYFDIVRNKCFKRSEENNEEFVISTTRHFSRNKFIHFLGRMFK